MAKKQLQLVINRILYYCFHLLLHFVILYSSMSNMSNHGPTDLQEGPKPTKRVPYFDQKNSSYFLKIYCDRVNLNGYGWPLMATTCEKKKELHGIVNY